MCQVLIIILISSVFMRETIITREVIAKRDIYVKIIVTHLTESILTIEHRKDLTFHVISLLTWSYDFFFFFFFFFFLITYGISVTEHVPSFLFPITLTFFFSLVLLIYCCFDCLEKKNSAYVYASEKKNKGLPWVYSAIQETLPGFAKVAWLRLTELSILIL